MINDIDSVISKRMLFKTQYSIINKNNEKPSVYKFEIKICLFSGALTYLDCQGKESKSLLKKTEWGWDSINNFYTPVLGLKTDKVGVLLKIE